jgi:small subunit ribosomal protein S9
MAKEEVAEPQPEVAQSYWHGTGRRKTTVAQVRLRAGSGEIVVNGRPFLALFTRFSHQEQIRRPLLLTETMDKFNVEARVEGGGISAWAGAIAHGIARALVAFDDRLKPALRKVGLMTRDPRIKERKKYGLKRARKAPQYTKR